MNEPVAFVTGVRQFDPVSADIVLKVGTPLYTHPVKELTDEEIWEIWNINGMGVPYEFAKAILRKASEK